MKRLTIVLLTAVASVAQAATWTFHAFQDNFYVVKLAPAYVPGSPTTLVEIDLDFGADLAGFQTSGIFWWGYNGDTTIEVTANTPAVVEDVPGDWRIRFLIVAQGFPDYNGTWSQVARPELSPGEYWLDFSIDGSYRVSATSPADFGKWAWDGSVNPSWVEPLTAAPSPGRGKKLGHAK